MLRTTATTDVRRMAECSRGDNALGMYWKNFSATRGIIPKPVEIATMS